MPNGDMNGGNVVKKKTNAFLHEYYHVESFSFSACYVFSVKKPFVLLTYTIKI